MSFPTDALPVARQIAIHQIRPVAHRAPEARPQLLEERQPTAPLHREERTAGDLEEGGDLKARIAAGARDVQIAVRLLRLRRRRLERVLAGHDWIDSS